MKKIISSITLTSLLLSPTGAFGADEFNPNFILSDDELQAQSMDRQDIQAFLDDKGGYIADLKTDDKDGTRRTVADIIYRAAQEHYINPKYLLVKLQKEQSLITAENPTQKALDGATGYGITDGCGWDCETYKNNKGFGKQVDSAAGIMRWYYDNYKDQSFIKRAGKTYTISGETVKPVNNATAFLYTYTPHIQGNQNFWILWNKWFEQVYPDGTLVKGADAADVYLLQDGKKRKIESVGALVTRFDPNRIITVPSSELTRYDIGAPISFPNYAILKKGSTYYLLDGDILHPFKSEAVFREYGYNPQEVIEVTAADIEGYYFGDRLNEPDENPLGRLIRAKENNTLYYIRDTVYTPIFDEQIADLALGALNEEAGSVSELQGLNEAPPMLFPDGTLLGIQNSNKIYAIEHGKKRHIIDESVFLGLGYKWENVIWTNQLMGIAHKPGQPLYLRDDVALALDETTTTYEPETSAEEESESQTSSDIAELMVRANTTKTIGPVFDTDIDTYLVADMDGTILAGKNIDQERPLASFTKVLTALTLFDSGINERKILTYDPAKHKSLYHRFRIAAGEMVRTDDLLDAFLVSSLNSPGKMLAQSVGTETAVIKRMNSLAKELGADDTTVVDVAGVEVDNLSTARDYLAIFKAAIESDDIEPYLARTSYRYTEVLDTDGMPDHFDTHSNDLANKANLGFTILASKTGYLYESGANLAMHITNSRGKEFIVITMGNVDHAHRFAEPQALAEWVFDTF